MIRVETPGFDRVLDFWRVSPYCESDVSLVVATDQAAPDTNALVCTPGSGSAGLYTFDNGARVFARVDRMDAVPQGVVVIERLRDQQGNPYAYITKDVASNLVRVPFVFDEALEGFELERYAQHIRPNISPALLGGYYRVKRFVPRAVIRELRSVSARRNDYGSRFPAWPFEPSLEHLRRLMIRLLLDLSGQESLPFVWFWPDACDYCLLLTHDVETSSGRDRIGQFIALEGGLGLRASYNLVPADYEIPDALIGTIKDAGCEVGVHGWTHDGLLFSDWNLFTERVEAMKTVASAWGAVGFRSPATHRNPDWFHAMGFDYDSSAPDTDPFEPQTGGCLSLFPFYVDEVLEIPITMPQDHTLFALLKATDASMWERKSREIVARHGVVCMLAHPDGMTGYAGSERVRPVYRAFLEGLVNAEERAWNPLPCELSAWWRARRHAELELGEEGLHVRTPASGMTLGTIRLVDGDIAVEPPTNIARRC